MSDTAITTHLTLAERAGFTGAAAEVKRLADRKRRLSMAYEHYRYVSQQVVDDFCQRLRASTEKLDGYSTTYDTLGFTPIEKYQGMPPADVLEATAAAKERGCFDAFEVAEIVTTREVVDPIVFGRIDGCTDRFFISDWGTDVRITDLLGEHDG